MRRRFRREYTVYIMSNAARTLYIGMTSDLERRVHEHKARAIPGFTAKYKLNYLVYYESIDNAYSACERERQLKGWTRAKKVALVESMNPRWVDLSADWHSSDPAGDSEGSSLRSG